MFIADKSSSMLRRGASKTIRKQEAVSRMPTVRTVSLEGVRMLNNERGGRQKEEVRDGRKEKVARPAQLPAGVYPTTMWQCFDDGDRVPATTALYSASERPRIWLLIFCQA